jgi:hypothetical protein
LNGVLKNFLYIPIHNIKISPSVRNFSVLCEHSEESLIADIHGYNPY